ncbi:MAG: TonB-dependent receptor [Ignavibacteriae bacterium]|nr:TonB-dependent receptor [Ignavibacteriota bacterium]
MITKKKIYFSYKILLILLFFTIRIYAGTTGKIVGKVSDKSTGEMLPGVNIIIENTTQGTATDMDGYFSIINVKPGKYNLIFKFIGYSDYRIEDVMVDVDRTTQVSVEMISSSIQINEVVVKAEKPPVQKDRTYSSAVVNADEISTLPVTEVSEVLTLQPGVVKSGGSLHFRGGREREVAYIIDGMPVTNSFSQSGGSNVEIENSMISQLEVITGTFNAEYGSAQSGIINIVTKDIARNISGSASVYAGDYLSNKTNTFLGIDNFNPASEKDFQFNINVPIISDKLGVSLVGRYNNSESLYWYEKRFNPIDGWKIAAYQKWFQEQKADEYAATQAIAIPDSLKTGDLSQGPLATYQEAELHFKINYRPIPEVKLSYQVFGSFGYQEGRADFARLYSPEEMGVTNSYSHNHIFSLRHTPSEKFFYNIGFSYQFNDAESYYRKDNKVASYPGDIGIQPIDASTDGFSLGTTDGFYSDASGKNYRSQIIFKGDFNWQADKYNFIKGGFEFKKHKVNTYSWGYVATKDWENKMWLNFEPDPTLTFENYWQIMTEYWKTWEDIYDTTKYRKVYADEYALWRDYTIEPYEMSAYLQDKVELGEIILNAGLRFDMFLPNEKVPINYRVEALKLGSEINLQDANNVVQLSPRLGLSFPISATGVFHAAYGHFFQMPSFQKMYNEPLYVVTPIQLNDRLLGNADLEPEKTIQYELGLQQQIIPGLTIDVSAYYKDIRNLLGVEYLTTVDNVRYKRFINRDYGNSKGITIGLRSFGNDLLNATLNYTYSTANGSSSNPEEVAVIQASTQIGGDPIEFVNRQIIPLDWDQRHTLNTVLNFNFPEIINLSIVGNIWSGQPYSPSFLERYDILEVEYKNASSKPVKWNVDLKASKSLNFFGLNYNLYLKVDNLFDNLNEEVVYSSTGSASENARLPENEILEIERLNQAGLFTLDEIDNEPSWYSSPRKIQIGFEVLF